MASPLLTVTVMLQRHLLHESIAIAEREPIGQPVSNSRPGLLLGIPGYIILTVSPHPDAVDTRHRGPPTLVGMVEESTGERGEDFALLFFRLDVSAFTNDRGQNGPSLRH